MSKVTSKLQVTIPKAIAEQYGIKPGDEIEFRPAGETIRIIPPRGRVAGRLSVEERLRLVEREIETGLRNWDYVEVQSGLEEGEVVVTSLDRVEVEDGQVVEVVQPDDAS